MNIDKNRKNYEKYIKRELEDIGLGRLIRQNNDPIMITKKINQTIPYMKDVDHLVREVVKCIDEYIKTYESKPHGGSRGQGNKPNEYINWDNYFVHSIEKWKEVKKDLENLLKLINTNQDILISQLNILMNLWNKMLKMLEDEINNSKKWPQDKFSKIIKKLNSLSLVVRNNKNINFIKCLNTSNQNDRNKCKLEN